MEEDTSVLYYVDSNPKLLISTENVRAVGYRKMHQTYRIPFEDMTDEQKQIVLASKTNITNEFKEGEENFLGEYKFTRNCFEIISRPWQVGLYDLSTMEHDLLFKWPKQKYFFLEPGTYRLKETTIS